jgi:hypothetical protein
MWVQMATIGKVPAAGTPTTSSVSSPPSVDQLMRKGDPAIAKISDEQVLSMFSDLSGKRTGNLAQFELWQGNKTPEYRAAIFDLYARAKGLGVDLKATRGDLVGLAGATGAVERPALERLAKALGMPDALPALRAPAKKDEVVAAKDPKPTPSQVKVAQDRATEQQKAAAAMQAQRSSSLFGVHEPVLERGDVKQLLTQSRVTADDIGKLRAAGVSAKEINKDLVKDGDGPMANLLTPEAMKALLTELKGKNTFLTQASALLPAGVSVKKAEDALAAREGVPVNDQVQAMVNQGMNPQEAMRRLLASLDPAPVQTNALQAPKDAQPPIAPALADPQGDNAQLKELLRVPAFKSIFADVQNRPVTAQDMNAMLGAVGPEGLKALGSAVVFGSGGIADRITPEAMTAFLQAVHTQSAGATAGAMPANAYAGTTQWQGPAAVAQQPLQFVQDPGLQYIQQTYGNNWGAYAASAALSLTASNLMPYASNFMYGGGYPYNPMGAMNYGGYGLYNPGFYSYSEHPIRDTLANVAGSVLGAAVGGALVGGMESMFGGWGGGYGGCYGMGGCWGLGNAMWNSFPGNMMGYNMMGAGWPYAMSFW